MPNFFPLTSIPLYAAAEALAYVKFAAKSDGNPSFILYFGAAILLNFTLWVFWWGYVDAYYLSPLAKFPITKSKRRETIRERAKMTRPPGSNFLEWMNETENDGIIRAPFPMVNSLLVTAPDVLSEVLVQRSYDWEKPSGARDILSQPLGKGLVIIEGEAHKFARKHLMPSFGFRNIKQLYPMMWKKSLDLMDHFDAEIDNQLSGLEKHSGRLEINSWASKATMDIIGVAALGSEFNAMNDDDVQVMKDFEELLAPDPMRIVHFFLSVMCGYGFASKLPLDTVHKFDRITESLHSNSARLVREKRQAMAKGGDHYDILGLLIKSNDFDDQQLADHVLTFLGAGHETTASAFTWTTYLLSTRPEYQRRLREEVRANLPQDREANTEELANILERLPLLNGICQETLRLYPTVPITVRTANKDTHISNTRIPKGTTVLLSPWAINRSLQLWGPQADQFIPERWITDEKPNNNGGAASNYSILTFLHGPRSCIGQGFAKAELRCLLAAMILKFEWTLDMPESDVVPAGVITIKPKKGMYLKMKKLNKV